MPRPRNLDLDGFVRYVDARPGRLGCWRNGSVAAYPTLAWLNVQSVVERRRRIAETGVFAAVVSLTSEHHNKVGIAVGWVTQHMHGPAARNLTWQQDIDALWTLSERYWALQNLIVEARIGLRGYESEGLNVRLPYRGNHAVDALDRVLDRVEDLASLEPHPRRRDPRLAEWMRSAGRESPWNRTPIWVRDAYRSFAQEVIARYPKYLSPDVAIAGFTVADLDAYWDELLARGMYMDTATMWGSEHPPTILPVIDRDAFVAEMAVNASIDADASDRITKLLTVDVTRCKDPALTPLVQLDHDVIPMSSLIVPGAPHRNTLSIIQSDPGLFGEVGRLLGLAGEREVRLTLQRMADNTLFASRVPVRREDGSPAGDLDIVVCDPVEKLLVVFEVRWNLAADGNAEVYRLERQAIDKRAQVRRLRSEIETAGARVRWPSAWPDVSGFAWRWFVLTRDVLATREIATDGVVLRSHQLLARTLRTGACAQELVDLLDSPPLTPPELCRTEWRRIRYGDLRVDAELLVA